MVNRYSFSVRLRHLLPAVCALAALACPAVAQRTELLPPRPVPLRMVLPDSLLRLSEYIYLERICDLTPVLRPHGRSTATTCRAAGAPRRA